MPEQKSESVRMRVDRATKTSIEMAAESCDLTVTAYLLRLHSTYKHALREKLKAELPVTSK